MASPHNHYILSAIDAICKQNRLGGKLPYAATHLEICMTVGTYITPQDIQELVMDGDVAIEETLSERYYYRAGENCYPPYIRKNNNQ